MEEEVTGQEIDVAQIETEVQETPAAEPAKVEKPEPTGIDRVTAAIEAAKTAKEPSVDDSGQKSGQIEGEWTPNYKVKAYDKEFEIPKEFHGIITKENEREVRRIFEKAYGLDVMSSKNEKLRETNTTYEKMIKEKYEPLSRGIEKVSKYLERDDFDSFFETLKVPHEKLQKWMLQKLQLKDLPPEQQELYNSSNEAKKRQYQLEQENEQYKTLAAQLQEERENAGVEQRTNELEQVLNRPDIKAIVEKYDALKDKPGAFKEEVILRAQYRFQTSKKDLSAEQAVKDFTDSVFLEGTPQAQAPQVKGALAPKAEDKKPTLPNIAGKTSSPAAQKVKTLDDLYKLKKQVQLSGR